ESAGSECLCRGLIDFCHGTSWPCAGLSLSLVPASTPGLSTTAKSLTGMKRSITPLILTVAVLLFFYLPMFILALQSFNYSRFGGEWQGFSWRWYEALWNNREIWAAARNSLVVATGATLTAVVLGTLSGWALHLYKNRFQQYHAA